MPTATETRDYLTKIYLSAFERAPDLDGLNYWSTQVLANGQSLADVGGTIFSLPIVTNIYPVALTNEQFVGQIYNNVLGRDIVDQEGLDYWTNQLTTLITEVGFFNARAQVSFNIISAALGAPVGTDGQAFVQNRLDVAEFTVDYQIDQTTSLPVNELTNNMQLVTADPASVVTATQALIGLGDVGETFILTTGVDNFLGTANNDMFIAGLGGTGAFAEATLGDSDILNGNGGYDTLSATLSNSGFVPATTVAPTLIDIEQIDLRFAGFGQSFLDLSSATGVQKVNVANSGSATSGSAVVALGSVGELSMANQATYVAFSGSTASTLKLNATNLNGAVMDLDDAVATQLDVTLDNNNQVYFDQNTGTATLVNVKLTGDNKVDLGNILGATTTVNASGTGSVLINGVSAPVVLETLNVIEGASVDTSLMTLTSLKTINAGTTTGSIKASVDTAAVSVTTGSGNDVIKYVTNPALNANINLGAGDDMLTFTGAVAAIDFTNTLQGGDGTDTLQAKAVWAQDATTKLTAQNIASFENLLLSDAMSGNIDVAKVGGMQNVTMNSHGAHTLFGLKSGATVTEQVTATGALTIDGALMTGPDDVLNLNLSSASAITQNVATSAVETIKINSKDTDTTAHVNQFYLADTTVKTIVVDGNAGVAFTNYYANTAVSLFDASAVTGAGSSITFASGNIAASGTVIKGGAGDDQLAGAVGANVAKDTISGGDGDDFIAGFGGADTLTGGAGVDTFWYNGPATDSNGVNADTITDFLSGTDLIDTSTVVTYLGGAAGYGAVLTSLTGVAYEGVLDTTTSTLYIDVDGNAALDNADIVINLTGVTALVQADFI